MIIMMVGGPEECRPPETSDIIILTIVHMKRIMYKNGHAVKIANMIFCPLLISHSLHPNVTHSMPLVCGAGWKCGQSGGKESPLEKTASRRRVWGF